ncbi:MAG: enoyl-CoA hydratase family protein [Actinomycetota bacterium]
MPFRASAPFTDDWRNFDFGVRDGVGTITLNRPERLNALTFDAYADLRDLFTELSHRDDVRVAILTGTGRGFCSGGDVHEIIGALLDQGAHRTMEFTRMTGEVVKRMRECPMPIIAAVNGVAAGAGAVLALAADFRLLAQSASFEFLFTKVGLAGADMGAAYLLPRLVGVGRATELLMLGHRTDADEACTIGLANAVVEDERLMDEALILAGRLSEGPAAAYAATKLLLAKEQDVDLATAIELEAAAQALLMRSEDHAEFYRSLQDKRAPKWTGR